MSLWGSAKARRVLAALLRIGWSIKRERGGSHKIPSRPGWPDVVFAFHDGEEIGPRMLARLAKRTGLTARDSKISVTRAGLTKMNVIIEGDVGDFSHTP